ncbi:MAG: SCO family protein [Deltaproteobacteria bacterium]|nr:SCO family protein [Deltaproteobacteria bacterium]
METVLLRCLGLFVVVAGGAGCWLGEGLPHGQKDMSAVPAQLEGADIVPKLGAQVPLELAFVDEDGAAVPLRSVMPRDKPTLLILGYWDCPMLCSFVLSAASQSLALVDGLEPGRDYQVVAVGIDPQESSLLAKAKQLTSTRELGRLRHTEVPLSSWRFLTAPRDPALTSAAHESPPARALAESVGFGYRWDPQTRAYAHAAGVFFVSPDGTLTRTLWGLQFRPADMRLAILEAGQGRVGSVVDRVLLSCFQFGPEGQYSVYVWGVMRLGGLVMIATLGCGLFALFRRDRRRERRRERLDHCTL